MASKTCDVCAGKGPSLRICDACSDSTADALRAAADRIASLERDLAELREAAREAIAANDDEPDLGQGAEYDDAVGFVRFCMAMDALAALLPAEPPKEASGHE